MIGAPTLNANAKAERNAAPKRKTMPSASASKRHTQSGDAPPSVIVMHNSDYAGHIDKLFASGPSVMKRVNFESFEVEVDVPTDDRCTWFFKGLSVPVINHLLRVVSCQSENPFGDKELTKEQVQHYTVPFDDVPFKVGEEELHVVYSIKDIEISKLRRAMIGPENVCLYEKDIPHFGPILVYKCAQTEIENEDTSLTVVNEMLPIQSDVASIMRMLETWV